MLTLASYREIAIRHMSQFEYYKEFHILILFEHIRYMSQMNYDQQDKCQDIRY